MRRWSAVLLFPLLFCAGCWSAGGAAPAGASATQATDYQVASTYHADPPP